MKEWMQPPPVWFPISSAILGFLCMLVGALIVMSQWAVAVVLSNGLLGLWGLALSVPLMAAQMLMLFEARKPKTACEVNFAKNDERAAGSMEPEA